MTLNDFSDVFDFAIYLKSDIWKHSDLVVRLERVGAPPTLALCLIEQVHWHYSTSNIHRKLWLGPSMTAKSLTRNYHDELLSKALARGLYHIQSSISMTTELTSVERESEESSEISEDEIFSPTVSPPKIYDISPERFCIVRGCPIEFRASFSAVPQGTVKWLLNKEEIVSDGRINIKCSEHFSVMSISKIEPRDSGRISFVVENDIGFDTAYASLTVQGIYMFFRYKIVFPNMKDQLEVHVDDLFHKNFKSFR